jgi:hypothetical protein
MGGALYSINFNFSLSKREGLAFFVAPTYIVVGILMGGIAMWIFSMPAVRCISIELIPAVGTNARVQLRIKTRSFPWAGDKVYTTNIGETSIREKLNPIKKELDEAARARKQSILEGLEHMSILKRVTVIAGRWIDQTWTSFFLNFKFAVLRFDVVKFNVQGETYKLDCSGYMLEDGLGMLPNVQSCNCHADFRIAIDRLIPVED